MSRYNDNSPGCIGGLVALVLCFVITAGFIWFVVKIVRWAWEAA